METASLLKVIVACVPLNLKLLPLIVTPPAVPVFEASEPTAEPVAAADFW